jgi:hypothetical protein
MYKAEIIKKEKLHHKALVSPVEFFERCLNVRK